MRSDREKEYLLKAIDLYKRKIIIVSSDYEIIASTYQDNWGYEKGIIGQFCYKVFANRDKPCPDCIAQEAMKTESPVVRCATAGIESAIEGIRCRYSYPIIEENGLKSAVIMNYDESGVQEMEDRLQRANSFLHNLINSAVDGVIAADINGKIIIFNESAAEICGYTVASALQNLDIRMMYSDGVAEDIMQKLRSDNYGGKGKLIAYRVDGKNKDGSFTPISLNAAIVYEDGKEVATIGFFHDLRQYIEIQTELRKTQLQLLQAEKMSSLGKLAAGVAHQLNNPLGGITLFSKLILEEYKLPKDAKDDVKRILRDAQRCTDIVKELLEFARQTKRQMHLLDINKLISRTLFLLESQIIFHNIVIQCEFDNNLPEVFADSQQLNHVFMNIILNAADAMEGKGVLTVRTSVNKNDKLIIEIEDTGTGIHEDVVQHIFEPFFTTKGEGDGTGLGLSVVYGIIKNHGGKISAESELGKGTKFKIELLKHAKE